MSAGVWLLIPVMGNYKITEMLFGRDVWNSSSPALCLKQAITNTGLGMGLLRSSENFVHNSLSTASIRFFLFCHHAGKSCSPLMWTWWGNTPAWKKMMLYFSPDLLSLIRSLILSITRLYDYGCWHTNGTGADMSIQREQLMQHSFAMQPHNCSSLPVQKSEVVLLLPHLFVHAFPLFWWPWQAELEDSKPHHKKWVVLEWFVE